MKIIDAITRGFCELTRIFCQSQGFDSYFKNYVETYTKKDKRVVKQAYDKYIKFKDIT